MRVPKSNEGQRTASVSAILELYGLTPAEASDLLEATFVAAMGSAEADEWDGNQRTGSYAALRAVSDILSMDEAPKNA